MNEKIIVAPPLYSTPSKRWGVFIACACSGFLVAAIFASVIGAINQGSWAMRMAILIQDLCMFILPALCTAILIAGRHRASEWLMANRLPSLTITLTGIVIWVASIPAMEAITQWNASWHLPEGLKPVEEMLKMMEESSTATIQKVLGGPGIGGLCISLFFVAILAGFSEEIFFRGTMQKMFGKRIHLAVWGTAFIFSALHFEFFGFVPRLLLGAMFGYALVWSGSLWLPILLHTLNNGMVVVQLWLNPESGVDPTLEGPLGEWPFILGSVVLTIVLVYAMWRQRVNQTSF